MNKYVKQLKASDQSMENNIYEVPINLGVSICHLLVIFMYTNHSELQAKYKKYGTRKLNNKQPRKELIMYHQEIARWYKLINQIITFFGNPCKKGDIFYTGMSIRLLFGTFQPRFLAPFSTSTEHTIATKFSQGNGIVLKLAPLEASTDYYLDVEVFSAFPDEKEKLYMTATRLQLVMEACLRLKMQRWIVQKCCFCKVK